jgi:hypothetical protein
LFIIKENMKYLLLILFLIPSICQATQIIYPAVYGPTSTVTNVTLNGDNSAISNVVNGGLDNGNANTTAGYRFYQTVAVLPSAGNQGAVYFLTSDNSLNFDTGSVFNKSISVNSPVNGDSVYYNSGWNRLAIGTTGTPIISNGTIPSYGEITASSTVSGASLISLSSTPSGAGIIPVANVGAIVGSTTNISTGQIYQAATDLWTNISIGDGVNTGTADLKTNSSATLSGAPIFQECGVSASSNLRSSCGFFIKKGNYYEWIETGSAAVNYCNSTSIGS